MRNVNFPCVARTSVSRRQQISGELYAFASSTVSSSIFELGLITLRKSLIQK